MFWGLIIEPNKRYTQTVQRSFHISNAALDASSSDDANVQVMLGLNNKNYLLCTLNQHNVLQTPLDLNFQEGNKIAFLHNGKGYVHLTGYFVPEDDLDEFNEDDLEEVEEEVPTLVKAKSLKRKSESESDKKKSKKKKSELAVLLNNTLESDDDDESFTLGEEQSSDDDNEDEDDVFEQEEEDDDDDSDAEENSDEDSDDEMNTQESEEEIEIQKPKKEKKKKLQLNGITTPEKKQKNKENSSQKENNKVQSSPSSTEKVQQNENQKKKKDKKEKKQNNESPQKLNQNGTPEKKTISGGVHIEDLKVGSGPVAKPGKFIQVYYEGRLKSNGKQFDASKSGPGFKFRLGQNQVIKGWDVGVAGMRVGGRRRITCPPNMAYGAKGSPPAIPPNSTLVFEVELKNVN